MFTVNKSFYFSFHSTFYMKHQKDKTKHPTSPGCHHGLSQSSQTIGHIGELHTIRGGAISSQLHSISKFSFPSKKTKSSTSFSHFIALAFQSVTAQTIRPKRVLESENTPARYNPWWPTSPLGLSDLFNSLSVRFQWRFLASVVHQVCLERMYFLVLQVCSFLSWCFSNLYHFLGVLNNCYRYCSSQKLYSYALL